MTRARTTVGIDPSLTGTGIVVLQNGRVVEETLVKSKNTGGRPKDEMLRLTAIVDSVREVVEKYQPELICIEGLAFMARNTSALVQLSGLNYLLRLSFGDTPYIVVTPSSLKKFISGKGNAQKDLMLLETYKRYGVSFESSDLADAFGLSQVGHALLDIHTPPLTQAQSEVVELLVTQL